MGKKSRLKNQKIDQAPKQPTTPTPWLKPLSMVVFVGLCILLFYPPYFRAMFFTREQLPTHIFTFILFILWWIVKTKRQETTFLNSPLDYTVFAFALIYFLTIPIAVNTRGAIQEFLKVTNYFMVYWLVSQLTITNKETRIILHVLVFSALGVAILGQGAALNLWEVAGGFKNNRIFSTIQYPNSLASYLTAAFFVTIGLFQLSSHKIHRPLYFLTAFILLLTVILTYSRGGWLIVPVAAVLYLIFIPRPKKLEALIVILALSVISVAITPTLGRTHTRAHAPAPPPVTDPGKPTEPTEPKPTPPVPAEPRILEERFSVTPGEEYTLTFEVTADGPEKAAYFWRVLVSGQQDDGKRINLANVSGKETEGWAPQEVTFNIPDNVRRISVRLDSPLEGTSFTARSVAVASGSKVKELGFNWSQRLPRTLYDRLFGFTASDNNVVTRFRYVKDAWEIVKDYPVLGLGGHGWKARYFQYQSANYSSTEVHNHFMQVWVDAGTVGLLIFLGLWLSFLYTAYNVYRKTDQDKKILAVAIATAVIAVVAHSLYDFNFSLGAIGIFLWALMGTLRSIEKDKSAKPKTGRSMVPNYLVITVIVILLIFTASLRSGYTNYDAGSKHLRAGRFNLAVNTLQRAAKFDPYDPDIRVTLADASERLGAQTQNSNLFNEANEQLEKALALSPYHPRYYNAMGGFLVRTGEFTEGFTYLRQAIDLQPYLPNHYNYYVRTSVNIAEYFLSQNDSEAAEKYINQVFPLEEELAAHAQDTRELAYALGRAHYFLGNLDIAEKYLLIAQHVPEDRAEAAMVLAVIYEKRGDEAKAKQHYDRAINWNPASVAAYDSLKQI